MSYNYTFTWPAGPNDVKVTGTFDNWSGSLPLVKQSAGNFSITVPFTKNDDKVLFKFIVDGEWKTSSSFQILNEDGNDNNVLYAKDLVSATESNGAKIPEAGGLSVASAPGVSTTVLPSEEGKQTTLGEPGVVVPENAKEIDAFKQVSDVDAKALNERLNAKEESNGVSSTVLPSSEGQQQTLGEPGIVVPENAAEIKEFTEIQEVDAKELNERLGGDDSAVPEGKKRIKVKKVIKRNKATGEEIVLSTEPVAEEEPKNEQENAAPVSKEEPSTPAKKSTPSSPAKKQAVSTAGKEEKKSFFRRLKKAFQ